jgi:hypothetical protein
MHNFGSLVLRPPGLDNGGLAPDEQQLKVLGDAMGDDTGYTSQYGWQLYNTSGTTEDWNYGAAGTFGYTMELGPDAAAGGNFHIAYQDGVVKQWTGTGDRAGRGVRKALIRISQWAASRPNFTTLYGRTPPGRILRLKKTFATLSSPVCTVSGPSDVSPNTPEGVPRPDECLNPTAPVSQPDKLEYTTKVPANGVYSWIVTPSTRPFEYKSGRRESFTLTCEDASGRVYQSKTLTFWRGEAIKNDLPCGGTLLAAARPLRDRRAPRSSFNLRNFRPTRAGIAFTGRSTDTAPRGLTPRVSRVLVSMWKRRGPKGREACRFITAQGTFSAKTNCRRLMFVPAQVRRSARTVTWTYRLPLRIPKGLYIARVRAVDAAGNLERLATRANGIKFRVR